MMYISTRGGGAPMPFQDTVLTGLARDGGLLLPERIPDVRGLLRGWRLLAFQDLAYEVIRLYADDIPDADLHRIIRASTHAFRHPDVTPVVAVGPIHVLELFHGPTLAFKDVALQFLGNLFEYVLRRSGRELNIVAATSGDTGSAAIHGVKGREHMRIFVMHPRGRVSPAQERQMTTVRDANVFNLAVDGTFDDCQRIVKDLFNDLAWRDAHHLGAVNSINWARVLAQVTYYFYAAFRVMDETGATHVRFGIPTGNFGDIFAGYVATRMGLPVERLVLATNENDILARFFTTGVYEASGVVPTPSPSMDIQVASNFERYLYYRVGGDTEQVRRWMAQFQIEGRITVDTVAGAPSVDPLIRAGRSDTATTLETIRRFWKDFGYLLDPHTAVGVHVGLQHLDETAPMICLATAHPAKFGSAIEQATGQDLAHHPILDALSGLPTRVEVVAADTRAVASVVERMIARNP
jgi:threonine synthase